MTEADLNSITMKSIRKQLEGEFQVDLLEHKTLIEELTWKAMENRQKDHESQADDTEKEKFDDEPSCFETKSQEEQDRILAMKLSESANRPKRRSAAPLKKKMKREKKEKNPDDPPRKVNGFTRPYLLSEPLSAVCENALEVLIFIIDSYPGLKW